VKKDKKAILGVVAAVIVLTVIVATLAVRISDAARRLAHQRDVVWQIHLVESRIISSRYSDLLHDCRELMSGEAPPANGPGRSITASGELILDFAAGSVPQSVSPALARLQPTSLRIRHDRVEVVFDGEHYHIWLVAFPEGEKGHGERKLIDGLWRNGR